MSSYPKPGKFGFLLYLGILPVILGFAFLLLATDIMRDNIPPPNRYYIGSILLAWGIYRGIMVWLKYKRSRYEDEDDHT